MQHYQIQVAGPIGPAAAARLPSFTTTALPSVSVLSGKVSSPDGLRRILTLLTEHGLSPIDLILEREHSDNIRSG